jgi:hypothetical protein
MSELSSFEASGRSTELPLASSPEHGWQDRRRGLTSCETPLRDFDSSS